MKSSNELMKIRHIIVIFLLISFSSYAQELRTNGLKLYHAFLDTTNLKKWKVVNYEYVAFPVSSSLKLKSNDSLNYYFSVDNEKIVDELISHYKDNGIISSYSYFSYYINLYHILFNPYVKRKINKKSAFKNLEAVCVNYWVKPTKKLNKTDFFYIESFGITKEYFLVYKNFSYHIYLSYASPKKIGQIKKRKIIRNFHEVVNRLDFS